MCNEDKKIKNYSLCLIESIHYNGELLIEIENVKFNEQLIETTLQNRPFELPQFEDANKISSETLPANAIDIKTRRQITVVATHYKSSSNQAAGLVAYCQEKEKCSSIDSTLRFMMEGVIVYRYVIASRLSNSTGLYFQFDGSGLVKGRGFVVVRMGGAIEGEDWNEIVRYVELFSGGAVQITKKLLSIIGDMNELQGEMKIAQSKLHHFQGLKLDNCNENTGEWNGVKKKIRDERERLYYLEKPAIPLTKFITKVQIAY